MSNKEEEKLFCLILEAVHRSMLEAFGDLKANESLSSVYHHYSDGDTRTARAYFAWLVDILDRDATIRDEEVKAIKKQMKMIMDSFEYQYVIYRLRGASLCEGIDVIKLRYREKFFFNAYIFLINE